MKTTEVAPAQAQATVERLLAAVADANAIGDLDSLKTRLEALTGVVGQRREEAKAARERARGEAREVKERIVTEAERIAVEATHWKASGERMAELLEEWKAAPHADRPSRRCSGSGCRRRATPSPSGARPTSPPLSPSGTPSGARRRSWSSRPRA